MSVLRKWENFFHWRDVSLQKKLQGKIQNWNKKPVGHVSQAFIRNCCYCFYLNLAWIRLGCFPVRKISSIQYFTSFLLVGGQGLFSTWQSRGSGSPLYC